MKKVKRWIMGHGYRFVKKADTRRKPTPEGWDRETFLIARASYFADRVDRGETCESIALRLSVSHTLVWRDARRFPHLLANLGSRAGDLARSILEAKKPLQIKHLDAVNKYSYKSRT